jgi:hypothetical protein
MEKEGNGKKLEDFLSIHNSSALHIKIWEKIMFFGDLL